MNKTPIGITFPIRKGKSGYFEQSFDNLVQAKSNIINLLKTRKGERILNPEFGSELYNLIFDPNDSSIELLIKDTIIEEVNRWIPTIQINNIKINRSFTDTYIIEILLDFSLRRDPNNNDIVEFIISEIQ